MTSQLGSGCTFTFSMKVFEVVQNIQIVKGKSKIKQKDPKLNSRPLEMISEVCENETLSAGKIDNKGDKFDSELQNSNA